MGLKGQKARMKLGVTATRDGMSDEQKQDFHDFLIWEDVGELHHGDCVGGDADAHEIAMEVGGIYIVVHPPTDPKHRAFCEGHEIRPEKPYLERNKDIVDETEQLFAAPRDRHVEERRSGTWHTIRYARRHDKYVNF